MVSVAIVEDDKAVREALWFLLRLEGFDIRTYVDAKMFLEDDDAFLAGCMVVDQHMPGMSGIELVATLRKRRCFIPSILITTWPDQALRMRAFRAGCLAVLEKPLKGDSLSNCIRAAIIEAHSPSAQAKHDLFRPTYKPHQ